jgi:hypothetical protein
MNARLIKETRDLLPIFAGTLPLIVVPQLIWPNLGIGYLALGVACVLMAGTAFGAEFQHRTLSLLLSQPIARSVMWRDKVLVLGAGMMVSLVALLGCLTVDRPETDGPNWLTLVFVPLCAFCGAPYWTLSLRHSIAGMVFTVGAPCGILAVYALVTQQFSGAEPATTVPAILCLLVIYCAVVYWRGYAAFNQLEAVDAPARELSLPVALEAILVAPLTKISSRFRGPFAALLKKEFRLQQVSFLLAGVFVLIAMAGLCLQKRYPEVAAGMVGGDLFVYVLVLPLIAGAIGIGEERGWAMAEWHLTLPPSALKQWSAKMLVTLSISVVLGLLLPVVVFLAADPLFGKPGTRTPFPPVTASLCWVLGQLLLTSVAVYAASLAKNTLQAIFGALATLALVGLVILVANDWARHFVPAPVAWIGYHRVDEGILPLLSVAMVFTLCLFQWLAWANFPRHSLSAPRFLVQLTVLLLSVWLVAWFYSSGAILS